MSVPFALLSISSLLYLSVALPFVLALNEQESWAKIRSETVRRTLKLLGILGGIGAVTMVMTAISGGL